MSDGPFAGEVRTGATYEAQRAAVREALATVAAARQVHLDGGLVLVFDDARTVRLALEEHLRAERVTDPGRVVAEAAVFAELVPAANQLGATLYIDVADPAGLADRLAELDDLGDAVTLEAGGERIAAHQEGAQTGAGALRLVFALEPEQVATLRGGGALAVLVDHPRLRARTVLSAEQVRAVASCIPE